MIRQATLDDIGEIVDWGLKFFNYSPMRDRTKFSADDFASTIQIMIENDTGAVFLNGTGFCGGIISPLYFNHAEIVGVELFWFAQSNGDELRRGFEGWARSKGARIIQMSAMVDDKERQIRRLFKIKGYEAAEIALYKEV